MDKASYGLYVTILLLSFLCCFLLLPLSDLLTQNSVLEDEVNEYQDQLVQLQNQTNELSKQERDLYDQINELENHIDNIEEQKVLARKTAEGVVEITQVTHSDDKNPSHFVARVEIYVTVHNYRTTDVSGLSVRCKHSDGKTETVSFGVVKAGSEETATFEVYSQFFSGPLSYPESYSLLLEGTIMDTYP